MSDSPIIWKNIIFYIILIAVIVFAAAYFLKISPIKPFVDWIIAKVNLPSLNLGGVGTLIQNNWATIAGVGVTAIPLGYAYIKSYLGTQKAKKELEASQQLASLSNSKAEVEIRTLKEKLMAYEGDTTADELQKKISTFSIREETLQNKINALTGQVEILQKAPANICESLWAKSGGQTVNEGGQLYRIIEKQTVKVV